MASQPTTTTTRAIVVAVAGGSGSGKTTLVARLVQSLPESVALVIELDHYYRDLSHLSDDARERVNFDSPEALELDLFHEHLAALSCRQGIQRPIYDYISHTRRSETVSLASHPVVIVDGLFALVDQRVNAIADLKVYVDTDEDLRLARRIRRDLEERGRSLDMTVSQYFKTVKPMHHKFIEPTKHHADIVVPWHHYNDRAVAFLAQAIRARLLP